MSQHEWAESSPLFFYSQRWTWNLLPASRKRSGNPSILNLVNVWLQFTRRQPKEGSSPTPQGILNHCFDDIENFMAKLQQTAEAATVLNQRKKKNKKKSKKQSSEGKKRTVFHWNREIQDSFNLCSLSRNNRRFTHCQGPASTRGGIRRHLPEI